MSDAIVTNFGGSTTELEAAAARARAQLEAFQRTAEQVGRGVGNAMNGLLAYFAVDRIKAFAESLVEMGDAAEKSAALMGISIERFTQFSSEMEMAGVKVGESSKQLVALQKNVSTALSDPASKTASAFRNLGITQDELRAKMNDQVGLLALLRDAYRGHANDANLVANMQATMGSAFAANLPYFLKTDEDLARLNEAAKRTQTTFGTETTAVFSSIGEVLTELGMAFRGLGITIGEAFAPAFNMIITILTRLIEYINGTIREFSLLNSALKAVVVTVDLVISAFLLLIEALNTIYQVAALVWNAMKTGLATFVQTVLAIIRGDWTGAWNIAKQGVAEFEEEALKRVNNIAKGFGELAADMGKLWSNLKGGNLQFGAGTTPTVEGSPVILPGTEPPKGGKGGGGKKETTDYMQEWRRALMEREIAENDYFSTSKARELEYWNDKLNWVRENSAKLQAEFQAAGYKEIEAKKKVRDMTFQLEQNTFNLRKSEANRTLGDKKADMDYELQLLRDQYTNRTITEREWYQQSMALHNEYLDYLRSLGLEGTRQWTQALKAQESITRQHTQNLTKFWGEAMDWIDSKVNSVVTGVLQGTQTWSEAFKKMWQDIATSFIVEVGKMMIKWMAFKALGFLGFGNAAKAVGNPFGNLLGAIGSAFGGDSEAGNTGGKKLQAGNKKDDSEEQSEKATALNTVATTANTVTTGVNTVSLMAQGAAWVAGLLGLTAVETIGVTSEGLLFTAITINTTALGVLTTAIGALTAATAADALTPFATGAWEIPNDMPAYIHKGEMIIPAKQAEIIRQGGAAGFDGLRDKVRPELDPSYTEVDQSSRDTTTTNQGDSIVNEVSNTSTIMGASKGAPGGPGGAGGQGGAGGRGRGGNASSSAMANGGMGGSGGAGYVEGGPGGDAYAAGGDGFGFGQGGAGGDSYAYGGPGGGAGPAIGTPVRLADALAETGDQQPASIATVAGPATNLERALQVVADDGRLVREQRADAERENVGTNRSGSNPETSLERTIREEAASRATSDSSSERRLSDSITRRLETDARASSIIASELSDRESSTTTRSIKDILATESSTSEKSSLSASESSKESSDTSRVSRTNMDRALRVIADGNESQHAQGGKRSAEPGAERENVGTNRSGSNTETTIQRTIREEATTSRADRQSRASDSQTNERRINESRSTDLRTSNDQRSSDSRSRDLQFRTTTADTNVSESQISTNLDRAMRTIASDGQDSQHARGGRQSTAPGAERDNLGTNQSGSNPRAPRADRAEAERDNVGTNRSATRTETAIQRMLREEDLRRSALSQERTSRTDESTTSEISRTDRADRASSTQTSNLDRTMRTIASDGREASLHAQGGVQSDRADAQRDNAGTNQSGSNPRAPSASPAEAERDNAGTNRSAAPASARASNMDRALQAVANDGEDGAAGRAGRDSADGQPGRAGADASTSGRPGEAGRAGADGRPGGMFATASEGRSMRRRDQQGMASRILTDVVQPAIDGTGPANTPAADRMLSEDELRAAPPGTPLIPPGSEISNTSTNTSVRNNRMVRVGRTQFNLPYAAPRANPGPAGADGRPAAGGQGGQSGAPGRAAPAAATPASGPTNITIHAVDARSLQQLLRANPSAVTGALSFAARQGNRTVGGKTSIRR